MTSHEVFEPDYWQGVAEPMETTLVQGGRINRDTKEELKLLFAAAIANIKVSGPVTAFDKESTLDWNNFDPGTVLLIDQESIRPSEPKRIDNFKTNGSSVFDDADMGARRALLSSNKLLTGPLRMFVYYLKSGYDPHSGLRYERYINLAAILPPARKRQDNRAIDFMLQIQTDQRNRISLAPRTSFLLPSIIGQTSIDNTNQRRARIREAMICVAGRLEAVKKRSAVVGKVALSQS